MEDIDILRGLGYKDITVSADNRANEDHTLNELKRRGVKFVDIWCDFKTPISKNNINCYKQYRNLIKKEKFDAIICHTPIVGAIVRIAARKLRHQGTKVIYMSHGLSWNKASTANRKLKFMPIEAFCSRMCDAIITINSEDYNEVSKFRSTNVYKIDGIGTNIEAYKQGIKDRKAKRAELGVYDDRTLVLAIGRLSPQKNHSVIIEALSLLENKDRYVYVICGRAVGESGIESKMRQLAAEKGIDVIFAGFRRDIAEVVHCADIGVIPSLIEGLGLGGVQQMCAGVPMVGTAVQGIKDYIIDSVTGFTVADPYDAKSFAEGIKKLSDPLLRQSMRQSCIDITERFSKEKSMAARVRIYNEVLIGN